MASLSAPLRAPAAWIGLLLLALLSPRSSVRASDPSARHEEVRALAAEAYVWGWPLVYIHQCRRALERVPSPGKSGGIPVAPINRLAMLGNLIDPRAAVVPCANRDVLYGFGIFDLAADAVVIQVPDFGSRFWLYQLGDQRTDAFARIGSLHGTAPGSYLVVGPEWTGEIPAGITAIFRSPTRFAYCLPRVHVDGTEEDRRAALVVVNRIAAYPLAEYDGIERRHDWSQSRWLPNLAARGRLAAGVTPESFFEALPEILADVPPLAGEEALYARLRKLAAVVATDAVVAEEAIAGAAAADRDVVAPSFEFRNVGRTLPAHWTTVDNGAAFGTDYRTRCAVAKSNVFVNAAHEARYYYLDQAADGSRLDGGRRYRLVFPAGSHPPARAFWSLTVYDERHALPEAKDGCRVGSHGGRIEPAPDGSVSILVGPDVDPTAPNTLVTPPGPFSLYLRVYGPSPAALDGSWTPPALEPRCDAASPVIRTEVSVVDPLPLPATRR